MKITISRLKLGHLLILVVYINYYLYCQNWTDRFNQENWDQPKNQSCQYLNLHNYKPGKTLLTNRFNRQNRQFGRLKLETRFKLAARLSQFASLTSSTSAVDVGQEAGSTCSRHVILYYTTTLIIMCQYYLKICRKNPKYK